MVKGKTVFGLSKEVVDGCQARQHEFHRIGMEVADELHVAVQGALQIF
jgi:hypothetical protein